MHRNKTLTLAQYSLFAAIIFLLGLTPLGFLMLPFAAITMVHVPVIVGALAMGVQGGAVLGFCFGLVSLIRCFLTPDATAAILLGTNTGGFGLYNVFLIIAILFVPRILTGVFAALTFKGLFKVTKKESLSMAVGAFVGSMTNTVLFLGGLYLFAFEQAAAGFGLTSYTAMSFLQVLLGIVAFNGVLEAGAAVILSVPLGKVSRKLVR